MNYRHAYHAGNFADVMKHVALMLVMRHLALKEKPFRVIDTHAGCGWYRLDSDAAERTGEWREGYGRLLEQREILPTLASGRVLADYIATVEMAETAIRARAPALGMRPIYPGSPAIAHGLLRPNDRLHANELHPEDGALLARDLARDWRAVVTHQNGWHVLKAALPPNERRGVILVDPPFEQPNEFDRLGDALAASIKRFATGIVLLWYPIKDRDAVDAFYERLAPMAAADREIIRCELAIDKPEAQGALAATGLIVYNPPFRFAETYAQALNDLAVLLKRNDVGTGSVANL